MKCIFYIGKLKQISDVVYLPLWLLAGPLRALLLPAGVPVVVVGPGQVWTAVAALAPVLPLL